MPLPRSFHAFLVLLLLAFPLAAQSEEHDLVQEGFDRLDSGRFEEAIRKFDEAQNTTGVNFSVAFGMASAHKQLGNLEEALAAAAEARAHARGEQQRLRITNLLGLLHFEMERERQVQDLPAFLGSSLTTTDWILSAAFETSVKSWDAAAQAFREVVQSGSEEFPEAPYYLSEVLAYQKRYAEASRMLQLYEGGIIDPQLSGSIERLRCYLDSIVDSENLMNLPAEEFVQAQQRFAVDPHGSEGMLAMTFVIDKQGRVQCPRVVVSPTKDLDGILSAVKQWRYEPARLRSTGEPISIQFFSLNYREKAKN